MEAILVGIFLLIGLAGLGLKIGFNQRVQKRDYTSMLQRALEHHGFSLVALDRPEKGESSRFPTVDSRSAGRRSSPSFSKA